jgi:hypothetical protein
MDLETLRFGSFTKLDTAIQDWSKVVKHLEKLEKEARDGLKAAALKANWAGVNATVSREFITKTAGEFADAHTEASSIYKILLDTHGELVGYRDQLNDAIGRGLKKNLTVTDTGNGSFTVTMNIHPDRAAEGTSPPDHSQQDVNNLRDEVERILKAATKSDDSAAEALRVLVYQAEYGFSGSSYEDRDSAAKALDEAEKYAELIKKKGDSMSPEEFDQLNRVLADYRNDPLFQEKFAATLGPKGTLEFWADLSDPSDGGALQRARLDQMGELQKNIGLTLAGATRSDSPAMRQWENQMVQLGDERIQTRGAQVYGFQLMSNLMRVGDYDDAFLNKYGNALVETEKKMKIPGNFWNAGLPPMPKMNFIGDDFGRDPLTGYMTALSKSPEAATDFFNATKPQDNAEWVLKDRPVFDDTPLDDDDSNTSREATGKALVAAATGVDPNDADAVPVEHSAENRRVLDRSLKYLSEAGDEMPSEFRDDMATVLVNYGDEVHHTASSLADDKDDARQLDRHHLMEVTKQVSRDQNAYGVLNDGLNQEMARDIYNDRPTDPKETLLRAGATTGFLEEARYRALETDKDDPSWDAKWLYHGFGGAANFIPVLGDAAQRGVDALAYQWQLDEQNRINEENTRQNGEVFTARENQLQKLADLWMDANPDHEGNNRYTLTAEINGAAFDGNSRAQGLAGDQ